MSPRRANGETTMRTTTNGQKTFAVKMSTRDGRFPVRQVSARTAKGAMARAILLYPGVVVGVAE